MILRDSYGWPVELVRGRPVLNFFRRLFVTNVRETWKRRHEGWPMATFSDSVGQCVQGKKSESP